MLFKRAFPFLAVCLLFVLSGCGTWRVVPSHGGGKRFDEEQRILAGSIRMAVAQMDFSELKGKKVSYEITSLAHDGGGQLMNPGISVISGGISDFTTAYLTNMRDNIRDGWDGRISYRGKPEIRPTVHRTSMDIEYLKAFLTLKMRMNGLDFMPKGGDATLFVLVDILGTNLSTDDSLIMWSDKLKATCECTYYAVDNKTSKMLFKPRSVSGVSKYTSHNSYFKLHNGSEFKMAAVEPTGFPLDEKLTVVEFDNSGLDSILKILKPKKSDANNDMNEKLELADTHIKARNFGAAESLLNEVSAKDPDNPNISAVRSRLVNELQYAMQDLQNTMEEVAD